LWGGKCPRRGYGRFQQKNPKRGKKEQKKKRRAPVFDESEILFENSSSERGNPRISTDQADYINKGGFFGTTEWVLVDGLYTIKEREVKKKKHEFRTKE